MHGGIMWVVSRGDKEKVEGARNQIIASIIGLFVAFLAFFVVNIAFGFFFPGKSLKDLSLPTLGPDTTPPSISITSPVPDSTVLGSTTIQANATDNKQVAKVEFYINGVLKNTDTTEPFSYNWDTKLYKNNSIHTILAKAYDNAGNTGITTAINAIVIDITKPTVNITSPANNENVLPGNSLTISASANDASSIERAEFRINGILKCTDYNTPYNCLWQIPREKGITYKIDVSAIDNAANVEKTSISVTTPQ